ncbi:MULTISPECIES: ATP-binding protein [Salinibaculum]|uniref:ATP-binding protein n=1 Tax=Salinibaculum TaxID=2732368 RepID=UPI0030CAB8C1
MRDRLTGSTRKPSVEWLLVSDGTEDTSIRYLVGTTEDSLQENLERILRTGLPNTYELTTVEWHPANIERLTETPPSTDLYTREPETQAPAETPTDQQSAAVTRPVAGVQFKGRTERAKDWQTPLTPFEELRTPRKAYRAETGSERLPLTTLIETMRDTRLPMVYQVLARPHGDWTPAAEQSQLELKDGTESFSGKLYEALSPRTAEERRAYEPTAANQQRLEELTDRETRRSFQVTARAVILGKSGDHPPKTVADGLATALSPLSGTTHRVDGDVRVDPDGSAGEGSALFDALCARHHEPIEYDRRWNRLRRRFSSPGVLVAPSELPGFCLVDGSALTPTGTRAIGVRHAERTGIPLPPPGQLARYRQPGMALVQPLSSDRQPIDQPLVLPPRYQPRHQVVVGDTGSGKSVLTVTAKLSNHLATEGPSILFDTKGSGTAIEYLQAHYRTEGSFENVYYFDLTRVLPAFSFFDIRPLLASGLPREEARSRKTGHYEEILRGVLPAGTYDSATESTKVIRNHLRALYDPVHGDDIFTHADLYETLQRTQGTETPPSVSESTFQTYFTGLLERDRDVFTKVLGGALSRVETIATDGRLAPLFDHVPSNEDDGTAASFDFADIINEDAVVIFDFGGMESQVNRTLTLVLLSNLWTALKARAEATPADAETPQVNLYLEEARDVADTELVDTLLSQGRSFNLSVMLGVQFLEQLDSPDPDNDTYREALNETATFVVGNVAVDRHLSSALATESMPPAAVERRLAALRRGEWLVRPGAGFGESVVRPFLGKSLPAPPGHPASDEPLTGIEIEGFERACERLASRTEEQAGISLGEASTPDAHSAGLDSESEGTDESEDTGETRLDSLLPFTQRLPECLRYDVETNALHCRACESRHSSTVQGLIQAVECCHSIDAVDVDDIPICELNLTLSPEEVAASAYSPRQLAFLQVVYNVQQRRYDPPEFDLLRDSMVRVEEYTGIDPDEIEQLVEDGLVTHNTDRPHRLYSVRPAGRKEICESHRLGIAYGHGVGDLDESTEHVLGIEVVVRWLKQTYAENPDSAVVRVVPYYDLQEGTIDAEAFFGDGSDIDGAAEGFEHHRLDVVGLDADGEIVVTVEVERINNDAARAVPADFDKMAACNPEEAIWVSMSHTEAHAILAALNEPLEGEPRVEKTYAETSPASAFRIDEPGFTDIYTLEQLREEVLADED